MTERTDLRGAAASDPHRPRPNDDAVPGDRADAAVAISAGSASATAKVILFGEHAVVYGHPAIAVPVASLTVRAEVTPALGASTIESSLFSGPLANAPERLRPAPDRRAPDKLLRDGGLAHPGRPHEIGFRPALIRAATSSTRSSTWNAGARDDAIAERSRSSQRAMTASGPGLSPSRLGMGRV